MSASLRPKPSAVWPKPWLNAAAPARGSGDMQHGLAGKAAFDQIVGGERDFAPGRLLLDGGVEPALLDEAQQAGEMVARRAPPVVRSRPSMR